MKIFENRSSTEHLSSFKQDFFKVLDTIKKFYFELNSDCQKNITTSSTSGEIGPVLEVVKWLKDKKSRKKESKKHDGYGIITATPETGMEDCGG